MKEENELRNRWDGLAAKVIRTLRAYPEVSDLAEDVFELCRIEREIGRIKAERTGKWILKHQ